MKLSERLQYTGATNNDDRARFVLEHAGLSKCWEESGLTRHRFISKHRSEIDKTIRASKAKPQTATG
jgi:hypothetical protein